MATGRGSLLERLVGLSPLFPYMSLACLISSKRFFSALAFPDGNGPAWKLFPLLLGSAAITFLNELFSLHDSVPLILLPNFGMKYYVSIQ